MLGGVISLCADLLAPGTVYRVHAPWVAVDRHDLLIARLVNRQGLFEIEGDPAVFPPVDKRRLVRALKRVRRETVRMGVGPQMQRMVEGALLQRLRTAVEDDGGTELCTRWVM
jgi:hypothetical protein